MGGAYLGPRYDTRAILRYLDSVGASYAPFDEEALLSRVRSDDVEAILLRVGVEPTVCARRVPGTIVDRHEDRGRCGWRVGRVEVPGQAGPEGGGSRDGPSSRLACAWGASSRACRFSRVARMAAVLDVTRRCIRIIRKPMCRCLAAIAWL